MNGLMTAKQAAEKWNITQRQVLKLCKENRIEGADRLGLCGQFLLMQKSLLIKERFAM